jgi:hypothetical protein
MFDLTNMLKKDHIAGYLLYLLLCGVNYYDY